jgi:hypothetical protein
VTVQSYMSYTSNNMELLNLIEFVGKDQIYVDTRVISHNIFLTEEQVENLNKKDKKAYYFKDKPEEYKGVAEIIPLGRKNAKINEKDIIVFKRRFEKLLEASRLKTTRSFFFEYLQFQKNLLTVVWGS